MKKTTLALIALVMLTTAAAVARGPEGDGGHRGGARMMNVERLAEYLSLTDAQKTQVEQLREQLKQTTEPLREEQKRLREAVETALDNKADAATVGAAVIAAHDNREKLKAAFEQHGAELEEMLTPAQVTRWRALKDARELQGRRFGRGRSGDRR